MADKTTTAPTLSKEWLAEPGSPLTPKQERSLWVVDKGDKRLLDARFCYLSEFEVAEAQAESVRFARATFKLDPLPGALLLRSERAFVLARALRQQDDIDVQLFKSQGKATPGEMALRQLPPQELERTFTAWWDWMDSEFPEAGVTKEQLDEMTEAAKGE